MIALSSNNYNPFSLTSLAHILDPVCYSHPLSLYLYWLAYMYNRFGEDYNYLFVRIVNSVKEADVWRIQHFSL